MKLEVPACVVGFPAFADFYRYPADRTQPAPLVIWVGGAIPLEKYEQRRATEPLEILAECEAARARQGDSASRPWRGATRPEPHSGSVPSERIAT